MTTPDQILLDLSSGQSTAESIAERLRVPMLTIDAMIRRHATSGLVERTESHGGLCIWKLTPEGRTQCPTGPAKTQFPKNPARQPATSS